MRPPKVDTKEVKKVKKKTKKIEVDKGGRPETQIDWEILDKLCQLQCTQKEIAYFFDCTDDTIQNLCIKHKNKGFSEYYAQKAVVGKIAVRRKQLQIAETGNTTMLIWLGQNWLGQSNRETVTNDSEKEIKVNINILNEPIKTAI
jgi:hypothetical protein